MGLISIDALAGQTEEDPRTSAQARFGPLYLTPTIQLTNLGVDTNVFNTPEPESDFTFTTTPRLVTYVPFRNASVTVDWVTDLVYF